MYAKVFQQIFHSSISQDYVTRHVFMDLLVLADRDGIVDMTPESISAVTRVPLHVITQALHDLSQPDLNSRSQEEEGRRIVLLDSHRNWGWQIVNHTKYKLITDDDGRKAYFREYKRRQRQQHMSKTVKDKERQSKKITQVEVEVDVDVEAHKTNTSCAESQAPHAPDPAFQLPLNDKTFFAVTEKQISHFSELYPAVNIEQSFRNMIGWLESNPTKRKTRRGITKFVNHWLSKEQDKPNHNGYKTRGQEMMDAIFGDGKRPAV